MKKNLLLVAIALLGYLTAFGQNPSWIYGADAWLNGGPVPLPIPQYDYGNTSQLNSGDENLSYQGQLATNASNMITDQNENIVFFVVDNHIYNKKGYSLGNLNISNYAYETQEFLQVKGASEILIIPNPGNCQQYYIISTRIVPGQYEKIPWVFLLDMGVQNQQSLSYQSPECVMGELVSFGSGLGNNSQNIALNIPSMTEVGVHSAQTPWYNNPNHNSIGKLSNNFLGATKKNANNEYFVFISNPYHIFRFKISLAGFSYDNYAIPFLGNILPDFNAASVRSELEVIELSNGNYRIACPYFRSQNIGVHTAWEWLFTAELDSQGNMISEYHFPFFKTPGSNTGYTDAALKGLEFSGDGNILYVTHSVNVVQPHQLEYFDFNNPTPSLVPLAISSSIDAKFSLLERDQNNAIYFTGSTGLYKLPNSNTPSTTVIQVSSAPGVFNFENNGTSAFYSDLFKIYPLPDQIDNMNYASVFTDNIACCVDTKDFDKHNYSATPAVSEWTGSDNPLNNNSGSDVTIKDELRIPAGKVVTIKNMNIYFSPGARLVIEHGTSGQQGGRLILDKTLLSVDTRCDSNALWLGVEVWGNANQTQGTWSNSTQGRLEMKNNSKIEHAWVGVLVSQRPYVGSPQLGCGFSQQDVEVFSYVNARNGGIVRASENSEFYNNKIGVYFRPYFGTNGMASAPNLSQFNNVSFKWFGPLKQSSYSSHAFLMEVKGILFRGCSFLNSNAPDYSIMPTGVGIRSFGSQFTVLSHCVSPTNPFLPCTSSIPSKFQNLYLGIHASNANAFSFACEDAVFENNYYGINVAGTKGQRIVNNHFLVRETTVLKTAGLVMNNSSHYKIEGNMFEEFNNSTVAYGQGLTYGVVVKNSGPFQNEIYRNTFDKIRIGGQTEGNNAVPLTSQNYPGSKGFKMVGLDWKCNNFVREIYAHDLTLISGRMDFFQGNAYGAPSLLQAKQNVAGNRFSYIGSTLQDHSLFVSSNSQPFAYAYIDAYRMKPLSFSFFNTLIQPIWYLSVNPEQALWGTPPMMIVDDENTCPSKLRFRPISIPFTKEQLKLKAKDLRNLLDGGNTTLLLSTLQSSNSLQVKQALLAASPYLSDEVLLAYISSNPPVENLKEVLLANSNLSDVVKNTVATLALPVGTVNQLAAAQVGVSPRTKMWDELNQIEGDFEYAFFDEYRELLFSEELNPVEGFQSLVSLLQEEKDFNRLKLLFSTYLTAKDTVSANQVRLALEQMDANADFRSLMAIQLAVSLAPSTEVGIRGNEERIVELNRLKFNALDKSVANDAAILLASMEDSIVVEGIATANSGLQQVVEEQQINLGLVATEFKVHVYPNPSSGMVTVDYPDLEIGNLEIKVVDLNGKIRQSFQSSNATNALVLDLSAFTKGVYLLQIHSNGTYIETQKITLD